MIWTKRRNHNEENPETCINITNKTSKTDNLGCGTENLSVQDNGRKRSAPLV